MFRTTRRPKTSHLRRLSPHCSQANTTWEVRGASSLRATSPTPGTQRDKSWSCRAVDGAVYFSSPGQVSAPLETSARVAPGSERLPMVDASSLLMIASDEGLYVRVEDELVVSPLDALLAERPRFSS